MVSAARTATTVVTVAGAGVIGLWLALRLARDGQRVRLIDSSEEPLETSASRYAGAMLAPYCEAEAAPPVVLDEGIAGLKEWKKFYPDVVSAGTLVVAAQRDRGELDRFLRDTQGGREIDGPGIAVLEPDLKDRFSEALFFDEEAHVATPAALEFLLEEVRKLGVEVTFGVALAAEAGTEDGLIVDARGFGASEVLPSLRGVRGERIVLKTRDLALRRPVRLLHPRHPIYVVPWGEGRFMVGATVIESEDASGLSVRSMLDLLGAAYAVHPAFMEAEIEDAGAALRPSFDDNVPRVLVADGERRIAVNGAYRHGFLLAPVLAQVVADLVAGRLEAHPLLLRTPA